MYGEDRKVDLNGRSPHPVIHTQVYNIIPPGVTDISVPPAEILQPLYWPLPSDFTGDKVFTPLLTYVPCTLV